jgi:hypothetical protein
MNCIQARRVGISIALTSLFVGGLLGCAAEPLAQQQTPTKSASAGTVAQARLTIPEGTEVHVTLSTPVGSETSKVGEALTATTTENIEIGGRIAIPSGSIIRGHVAEVTPGTTGMHISEKGGSVVLAFNKVTTPAGDSEPLAASLTSMASSTGKTAGIIGGSAAGGALLGKILGHDTKDAAIGAVVGGGIGTAIVAGTKGKELKIPAGTDLILTLSQPLKMADRT